MTRVAVYSRYSSSQQRDESADDQITLCRRYADAQGWTVVGVFEDRAISGASIKRRPGFLKLLAAARTKQFDVVLAENTDRLSRTLADVASLHDRLQFQGIRLFTVHQNELTTMHVGIMGMLGQMTLSTIRQQTRRGQQGRIEAGFAAGGLGFGYRVVPSGTDDRNQLGQGSRAIDEVEASIVRRVFRDYDAGLSPRRIARDLNAECVPGPKGRPWIDTTIRGQVDRGTGLLNNRAYNGELVWNQCSYVKDPDTGHRLARPNPPDKHVVKSVPELRIVDQDLWKRVKRRQQEVRTEMTGSTVGHQLNGAHRHAYLLGGTRRCGVCGGAYTIIGKDRYGCATRRGKGTCDNAKTIGRQILEPRVLNGLKEGLLTPELVKGFVERFTAEIATSAKTADADKLRVERDLRDVGKRLAGVLQAVESGTWSKVLSTRLAELEARQIALQSELEALSRPRPPLCPSTRRSVHLPRHGVRPGGLAGCSRVARSGVGAVAVIDQRGDADAGRPQAERPAG